MKIIKNLLTKKNTFLWLSALSFVLGMVSCKKYLNIVPDNVATIEYAFRNRNETENYLFGCFSTYQTLQGLFQNAGFATSGEVVCNLNAGDPNNVMFTLIRGTQVPDAPISNDYPTLYQAIRRCNIFLDNVNSPPDLTQSEKDRWIAEAKFLKAYYYYYLVRKYGPVPLIKSNLPIDIDPQLAKEPRSPADVVFKYALDQLEEALSVLPLTIQDVSTELGRPTKIIAAALKAKILITQASPLFNGNADVRGLRNNDGTPLFAAEYDPEKWVMALGACKQAIDMCNLEGLKLYKYVPSGSIGNITDSLKTLLSIQGPVNFPQSNLIGEAMWPGNRPFPDQNLWAPAITTSAIANRSYVTKDAYSVPLAIADLFYSKNGVPIEEDNGWDYAGRYSLTVGDAINRFYVKLGYATVKLNLNREPRYYADLAFDGGIWFGYGVTNQESLLYMNALPTNSNTTGYWPKKLIPFTSNFGPNTVQTTYYPNIMRLADLYLLYAESENEVNGPGPEAYKYIDLIRERAGLKDVVSSWNQFSNNPSKPLTKDGLRNIIHQERRIELCFEGEIGWDLRRWKEYLSVLSRPVQGWVFGNTPDAASYYKITTIFNTGLGLKDYFWPISSTDLLNNQNLVQNLYW